MADVFRKVIGIKSEMHIFIKSTAPQELSDLLAWRGHFFLLHEQDLLFSFAVFTYLLKRKRFTKIKQRMKTLCTMALARVRNEEFAAMTCTLY